MSSSTSLTAPLATGRSTRRQFLVAGSTAIAAAALLGGDVMPFPSGLELLADAPGARVPIAYLPGSAGVGSLAAALAAQATRAVPALGLRADDATDRDATLSIAGFAGEPIDGHSLAARYGSVYLDALIPSPVAHGETIPYYAWTHSATGSSSASTRLRLAGAPGARVGIGLTTKAAAGAAPATATAVLGTHGRRWSTFQPGVYLLGLEPDLWASPADLPSIDDPTWFDLPSIVMVIEEPTGD